MTLLFFVSVVVDGGFRAGESGWDLLFREGWPEESWPTPDARPRAFAFCAKLAISHFLYKVSLEKKAGRPGVVNFSEARVGLNIDDLLYWQLGGCRGTCCTFVRQVRKDVGTCTCAVCL